MTSKERSARFEAIFKKAKINVASISVLGDFVHIDTYDKYSSKIVDIMTLCGFRLIYEKNGLHLSGYRGTRLSFKLGI